MTRSEMQHKLAGYLSGLYETDKHPLTQLPKAALVLDFLESEGMLPPDQGIPAEAEEPSHPHYYGKHEWEDEA